jgi:hypothetical protein
MSADPIYPFKKSETLKNPQIALKNLNYPRRKPEIALSPTKNSYTKKPKNAFNLKDQNKTN